MVVSAEVAKSYFAQNSFPSEEQFANLVDTIFANNGAAVIVYSGYNADAKVDDDGNPIPTGDETTLGRKYRVNTAGIVDFGQGPVDLSIGDYVVCIRLGDGPYTYQWVKEVLPSYETPQKGAMQYYATYDADLQVDDNGEAIPTPGEEYQGRQYVVTTPGSVDLNGFGAYYWNSGDIIACIKVFGVWQWILYGNTNGGGGLPTAGDGEVLAYSSMMGGWFASEGFGDAANIGSISPMYRIALDADGITSLDWNSRVGSSNIGNYRYSWGEDFSVFNDSNQLALQVGSDGRTYAWSGFYGLSSYSEAPPSLTIEQGVPGVYMGNGLWVNADSWLMLQVNDAGVYLPKLLDDNPWILTAGEVSLGMDSVGKVIAMANPYDFDNARDGFTSGAGTLYVDFASRKFASYTVEGSGAVTLRIHNKGDKPFSVWDADGKGGGLYVVTLKNNIAGTPRVFTFHASDYKLSTGTTVTVGSAMDSTVRFTTLQFIYYNGKLREVGREDGGGIGVELD